MSIRVMTEVWRRLGVGGGELLLALALADHAHDDGSSIYPSVATLAQKTRQSERTVQRQIASFRRCGWLGVVRGGRGGRARSTVYAISSAWLRGAPLESLPDVAEASPPVVARARRAKRSESREPRAARMARAATMVGETPDIADARLAQMFHLEPADIAEVRARAGTKFEGVRA